MHCPNCNVEMKPYVYGFPTPDLMDKADNGEIILGGCVVFDYKPTHYCNVCQEQYPEADEVGYQSY